jgi:hypothetical protein
MVLGSGSATTEIALDFGPCEQSGNPVCLIKREVQLKYQVRCITQRHLTRDEPL